ncbi:RsmB/NOP family class I SAM-dependent RNA methyltransferase [Rhodovibrionaceae bacterium A322]
MTPAARLQAVLDLFTAMEAHERPADRVAQSYFRERRYIGSGDRREISQTCYALLRSRARLGWWLDRVGGKDSPRSLLLAWLVLAQGRSETDCQALFSGGRYSPEAMNDREASVVAELIKEQYADRDVEREDPLDHDSQPAFVRYELPQWSTEKLLTQLGRQGPQELKALRYEAAVDLRVNTLVAGQEEAKQALAEEGIESEEGQWSPLALRLDGRKAVAVTKAFKSGMVEVQDEGSQVVAQLVDARPGKKVVDFCAGAGGKTLALAAAMKNRGQIIACDTMEWRLKRSAQRLKRAKAFNVTRRVLKTERDPWVKKHKGDFDRVLVDAPCSGSGTWRRNPEAKWRFWEENLDELTALQASILASAGRLVAPGGRLIYATCSLLEEENEAQIDAFMEQSSGFEILPVAEVWKDLIGSDCPDNLEVEGRANSPFLRLGPAKHGTDGFFVAILERSKEA